MKSLPECAVSPYEGGARRYTIECMRTLIENRRARFDYEILETTEAGLKLLGHEVKAIKGGRGSLRGSFITLKAGEAYLVGADVPPYQPKNVPEEYNPKRDRKLLLSGAELKTLVGREREKGLTIIPLRLYNKHNKVKLEIGVARGKKKRDKRETIKRRDAEREIRRSLKRE